MIASEPKDRPDIDEIIKKDPWLKEINDIEDDKEKFPKFKEEYKNYIQGILDKIIKLSKIRINKNKKAKKEKHETRNISSVSIKERFDSNMKPKKLIAQKYNYKYYMKLIGDINPAEFMNVLIDEMEKKYINDCQIGPDDKKLKLTVAFIEKECEMDIKLYKLGDNEHIIVFDRKSDEDKNEIFYNYVSEIKDIIRNKYE